MCCKCQASTARVITDVLFGAVFVGVAIGYGIPTGAAVATSMLPSAMDLLSRGLDLMHVICKGCCDCDLCHANAFTVIAWRYLCQVPLTGVLILVYLNFGFIGEEFMAIFMTAYGVLIFLVLIIIGGSLYSCQYNKVADKSIVGGTTHVLIGVCFGSLILAEWLLFNAQPAAQSAYNASSTTVQPFVTSTRSVTGNTNKGFFYSFNAVLSIALVPLVNQTLTGISEVIVGVTHARKGDFVVSMVELLSLAVCFAPIGILFGLKSQDFIALLIGVGLRVPSAIMCGIWSFSQSCPCIKQEIDAPCERDYVIESSFASTQDLKLSKGSIDTKLSVESISHRPLRHGVSQTTV